MTTGTMISEKASVQLPEFANQALTDFSQPEHRAAMEEALATVRSQLGREYPLLIGGREVFTEEKHHSFNPSRSDELVGTFQIATVEHVEEAVSAAAEAFEEWKRAPAAQRVELMLKVSEAMQRRRFELAAWMVIEVGKSWVEADADVAEAIDFCEYYARQMLCLDGPGPLVPNPGEANHLRYIPLGVGVVIPPWNFPLAILAGMTFASVVSGNTAIVKPSSDSPTIAAQLMEIMVEAGCPPGVVNFLPGSGSVIGDPLVLHPQVRFIAFTGSKEVGLRINEFAARTQPGQIWIKRVVAEMGGKDSIVVAEDADLEAAAEGIVASAFGFQGQKCSACSRAIIVDSVYDQVLERVEALTRDAIREGSVEEPTVNFGPVINGQARESILGYIEKGLENGRLVLGGEAGDPAGFYVRPTIIADVAPDDVIAQEEIFGPVLAVIRARDYDHALEIANNTEFGLTGSVYSSDRDRLDRGADDFHVGNLYLNRKCTGALVGVHPFGGFNMSGTDSKAGGPDYLLLFTQAKTITEKI